MIVVKSQKSTKSNSKKSNKITHTPKWHDRTVKVRWGNKTSLTEEEFQEFAEMVSAAIKKQIARD